MENPIKTSTLITNPIHFVKDFDEAQCVWETNLNRYSNFLIIADNSQGSKHTAKQFKGSNTTLVRLRGSGSWNNIIRTLDDIERHRDEYNRSDVTDLLIISLFSAHDISAALKRHRAVNFLSCREMYWLDSLKLGVETEDAIELALRCMPNVPVPIMYADLSTEQRLALSAFEFSRYTRPVHCVNSVENMQRGNPFYTNSSFDEVFATTQARKPIDKRFKSIETA